MSAKASRPAIAQSREAVVSLTQTEIILVLAAVLLLLLLAKNSHLAAAEAELADAEETVQRLDHQMTASREEIAEQQEQADLAREVKEVLSRDGKGELAADRPRLAPQDVEAVRQALAERDQQRNEQAAVDEALARSNIDASDTRAQQLERLADKALTGAALSEVLSANQQAALSAAQTGPQSEAQTRQLLAAWLGEEERHQQRNEQAAVDEALARSNIDASDTRAQQLERLGDKAATGAALSEVLSAHQQAALNAAQTGPQSEARTRQLLAAWLKEDAEAAPAGTGDKVGFTPCWPRVGERQYFLAYDVTYANGEYEVRPHRDWESGATVVADALAGPLGQVLRAYPRGPVPQTGLRTFGQRVEAAVQKLREQGTYRDNCLLAVTLNGEASGNVGKFIRQRVPFYPITR